MNCPKIFMEKQFYDSDNQVRPLVPFAAFGPQAFCLSLVLTIPKFHGLAIGAKSKHFDMLTVPNEYSCLN